MKRSRRREGKAVDEGQSKVEDEEVPTHVKAGEVTDGTHKVTLQSEKRKALVPI